MPSTEAAMVSSQPLTTSPVPTACIECEVLKALVDMDTKWCGSSTWISRLNFFAMMLAEVSVCI